MFANTKLRAHLMLLIVTALWGGTLPVMHFFTQSVNTYLFVLFRFIIAVIVLLPLVYKNIKHTSKITLKYGFVLGLLNSLIFLTQTEAVKTVSSPTVAFLLSVYVIVVPLLYPVFGFRKPRVVELLAGAICLYGVYLLYDVKMSFAIGYVFALLSMLFIALMIIVIERASVVIDDLMTLNFYQIAFAVVLPGVLLSVNHVLAGHALLTFNFWVSVLYCAIPATALAFAWQIKYQKYVGASKAALIFSLEAVFASIFAWGFGETITSRVLLGGMVILLSVFCTDIIKLLRRMKKI